MADAQVRTFVVMFALIALAAAGGSDLGEPLAADELVEAIIHSLRWADGQQDMADYWQRRRAVLTELLTADLEPWPSDPDRPWRAPAQDRALLLDLLEDAAQVVLESLPLQLARGAGGVPGDPARGEALRSVRGPERAAGSACDQAGHRAHLRARGITAVVPEPADQASHRKKRGSRGGRPVAVNLDDYKQRNVIERAFNRLKQWRALATRYDCEDAVVTPGTV